MYTTILVPLDGSKRAEAILNHVEEIAQRFLCNVIFLQVVEPTLVVAPEMSDMTFYQKDLERRSKEAEGYLSALKGEFREKGIETRIRVVYGPVVDAIHNAIERENVDLVAIASHGRSGLSRVFYGSVAAGLLHRVECPLLVVRSRETI